MGNSVIGGCNHSSFWTRLRRVGLACLSVLIWSLSQASYAADVIISGVVFEDINYGGGDGRDLTASSGAGINGAVVEIYDGSGSLLTSLTTASISGQNGSYIYITPADGTYYVRVVNSSLSSTRGGSNGSELGVQTFRSDGATATISEIGGRNPALTDSAVNSGSEVLNTSSYALSGGGLTQSLQPVTVSGASVANVDFGFNFDTIVNVNDSGQGSFRQFIINANLLDNTGLDQDDAPSGRNSIVKAAGVETSVFEIPGTGPHTILTTSTLDKLSKLVHINGYTQNGSSLNTSTGKAPLNAVIAIELDGLNAGTGVDGLFFNTGSANSLVKGLSIVNFDDDGINVAANATAVVVQGNFIGVRADGTTSAGQNSDGIFTSSSNNIIGGPDAEDRNLISGNGSGAGVLVSGVNSNNALVQGNYIGVARDGVTALPNLTAGVYLLVGDQHIVDGNVTSGNTQRGILLNANSADNTITDNYVGTDYTGTLSVPNKTTGIEVVSGSNNMIGGSSSSDRNVISGNTQNGVRFLTNANDNSVVGNFIGVAVSGENALANGKDGLVIYSDDNSIGGLSANEGNVIAGNGDNGIYFSNADNTTVQNNRIGISLANSDLGNAGSGILISGSSANNTIGGTDPNATNIIAHNVEHGIQHIGTGVDNSFVQNSIFNNAKMGINLGSDTVTLNDDVDADSGPNQYVNFPLFSQVNMVGSDITIAGCAPAGSTIELFEADVSPTSTSGAVAGDNEFGKSQDYGEGEIYLTRFVEGVNEDSGATAVTCSTLTDADGNVATGMNAFQWTIAMPPSLSENDTITATATLSSVGTSEYSVIATIPTAGVGLLEAIKTVDVWDPDNEDLYAVPGNDVVYTLTVRNVGEGPVDEDSMILIDSLPSEIEFWNGDIDASTGRVGFEQTIGSGVSFDAATDVKFKTGATPPTTFSDCSTVTADETYRDDLTHICLNPKGVFESGTPDPTYTLSFRTRVK